MNNYMIYIKSHTDAPDYEDTVQANSKIGAAKKFAKRMNLALSLMDVDEYWNERELYPYIMAEKELK